MVSYLRNIVFSFYLIDVIPNSTYLIFYMPHIKYKGAFFFLELVLSILILSKVVKEHDDDVIHKK